MSVGKLQTAVAAASNGSQAIGATAQEPRNFLELLDKMKPEIARALPKHLNADRMCRIALTEFRKAPKLAECNLQTVFGAIITLAQLGLEPGVLGQAYLIPYGNTCTAVPGWQGYADLVARGGRASVWTGAVFEGDEFDYAYGDSPFIKHRPNDAEPQTVDRLRYCYAVGRIKGAEWPIIEVWSVPKITKHRDKYNKVGGKHYSFQHFEMYGRKVPLLQVIKYMPKSVELQQMVDLENASENGQPIDLANIQGGDWQMPAGPTADTTSSETTGAPTDKPTEQKSDAAQIEAAINSLKGADDLDRLDEVMDAVRDTFRGRDLSAHVEATFRTRRTELRQGGGI